MCVNDVAGYHCKAWKCVMNNKGLQKPQIKKNKKWNEGWNYFYKNLSMYVEI